jgi:hypothetical protein
MKLPMSMVIGFLLLACNWSEPIRAEAASKGQSATPYTQTQQREREEEAQQREREEYVKSIRAKLDGYDKKLDGLEARASAMSGSAKDDFRNMIVQLRTQKKI